MRHRDPVPGWLLAAWLGGLAIHAMAGEPPADATWGHGPNRFSIATDGCQSGSRNSQVMTGPSSGNSLSWLPSAS